MGIEWRKSVGGKKVMHVTGRFDFSLRKEFMEKIRQHQVDPDSRLFDLDLSGVTGIDTAGLGMLLVLLDRVGADRHEVALLNCSDAARRSLQFVGFERCFRIA